MLQWLRTTRRELAGTAAVLLAGAWLALAAAPCFAAGADAQHDAHGDAGHCEHCLTAETACADATSGSLPAATPAADFKPFDPALPAHVPALAPRHAQRSSAPVARFAHPHERPPWQRFCRQTE